MLPLAWLKSGAIVSPLRCLRAAVVIVTLAGALPCRAHEPTAKSAPETSGDDSGVDVITAAGAKEAPPKREASITMDTPGVRVRWNPQWTRFGVGNYIGTGVMLAATLGSLMIPPVEDRWLKTNSFDVGARNALLLSTESGQLTARDASDVTLLLSTNLLLVDSLVVAWWGHDAGDVAYEMVMMGVEALAFNNAINGLVSALTSRQRPYGLAACATEDGAKQIDCTSSKRYRSFFSGHASTTFAVAGVTCMHHAHLPLYGGGLPEMFTCASAFGLAAATATLRVVADQHWTSDVIVGSAFGTFSGLFIPWVLHYRTGDAPDKPDPDGVSFRVLPSPTGANLTGTF